MPENCDECGRSFSSDMLITFGDQYICADCKSIFLQRIREGADRHPSPTIIERLGLGRMTGLTLSLVHSLVNSPEPILFEDRAKSVLSARGFRNIRARHDVVTAERGRKLAALVGGDPLRNYHRVILSPNSATFIIDTWFMMWRPADFETFRAESTLFQEYLGTGVLNDRVMKQAQIERKRSDFIGNLLILGYVVGFLLLFLLILLLILR